MGLDFNHPKLDSSQKQTLKFIAAYTVAIMILWKLPVFHWVLFPFKIMTVGLHEFGHAIVGKLTGAKVEKIELDLKQGGLTQMRGGWRRCTLPAGYLGSSVFGGLMVMCGFEVLPSKVASVIFAVIMLMVLYWAGNWVARITTLAFFAVVAILWFIKHGVGIRYVMLFLGVMSCLYSIWDIIEDLVLRKVNESDASQFAKLCSCCPAQVWGVLWGLLSVCCLAGGILAGLVLF
jgi:hypothetical protein